MRYSIKAAAIATGVSESRLRTWERRYGTPQPGRSATGRRLYDEGDLAVIRRMAALVAAGIPPSEAASVAKTEGEAPESSPTPQEQQEHALAAEIRRASDNFDEDATVRAVREAVSTLGWPRALDEVLMPALRGIGRAWGENAIVSANEHFTSEIIRREIAAALAEVTPGPSDAPKLILACPEDERHELGLLACSLLLRQRGLQAVYLGADVPTSDLLTAIQVTNSDGVCLSATTRSGQASLTRAVRALASARVPVRLFAGGPSFYNGNGSDEVAGVLLPPSLDAAAGLMAETLGVPD